MSTPALPCAPSPRFWQPLGTALGAGGGLCARCGHRERVLRWGSRSLPDLLSLKQQGTEPAAPSSKGDQEPMQEGRTPIPGKRPTCTRGWSELRGSPFLGKCCGFHTWAVTQAPDSIPVLSLTQRVAPGRTRSRQPCTPQGREEAAQALTEKKRPQPGWAPHPVPPQRGRSTQGTCADPQPCSLRPHRLFLLSEAPGYRGDGHSCPHPAPSSGIFPAALPGRAGEEEMGMGWRVHTSSALSQLSAAPSHPDHHMPAHTHPPRPPRAPGQTHSTERVEKKKKNPASD